MVSMHDIRTPADIGRSVSGISLLAFDAHGKIMLLKEFRMAVNSYVYNLCAGMLEPGETVPECAVRELHEETGITGIDIIDTLNPCYAAVSLSDVQNQLVVARVNEDSRDTALQEENENIEAGFYDREQTAELLKTAYFSSMAQLAAYLYSRSMLDFGLF